MDSKLDDLLESIGHQRALDLTMARADQAINSFDATAVQITDWDAFRTCLARFYQHMETTVLCLSAPMNAPLEFYWGRCVRPLLAAYGINGEKAAFEMARTGAEGGLYVVLKAIAHQMAEEYAGNEISARILTYWNSLSVDEKLAAPREYLARFGQLLPGELTEGSAARIRANFPKVLEQHPRLMRDLSRTVRRS